MKQLLLILFVCTGLLLKAEIKADIIVAQDGSGDFNTVQDAFLSVPDYRKNETVILIKKGIYKEKLILPSTKVNVTIIGEDVNSTVITYDDYASKLTKFGEGTGTSGSSGFFIFGDNFTAKNITFENSSGDVGQAVAVRVDGDKVRFFNCRFLGNQDTLYPHGINSRQYYKNCYIEGTVDFIFGSSTALFDDCTIFCKRGGYVTAASTGKDTKYGFIFRNCKIEGSAPTGSVYLGRPWRNDAKTVYINCEMSAVINPEGWHDWGKQEAHQTTFYAEYNSSGEGAHPNERVNWMHHLTKDEIQNMTYEKIFEIDAKN